MLDICPGCGCRMVKNSTKPTKDRTSVYFKCKQCDVSHHMLMMRAADIKGLIDKLSSQSIKLTELERQLADVKAANATFVANSLIGQAVNERTHAAPPSYTEPTLYERRVAFQETYGDDFNEGMFMQTAIQNGWAEPITPLSRADEGPSQHQSVTTPSVLADDEWNTLNDILNAME